MCFGSKPTTGSDKSYTANPLTSSTAATQSNLFQNLATQGFQPYQGNQVAGFGPLQGQSFDIANAIGQGGVQYAPEAKSFIDAYGGGGPQSVNAQTIDQRMSPYMNQYVMQALAPQLRQQDLAFQAQDRGNDAAATAAGAFGNDSQAALKKSNDQFNQQVSRQGLIGNAYNAAFNTAIGAGAQDVSNNLNAQNANAGYMEQALGRQLGAAGALQGLGSYQTNTGINQAELLNRYGAQQTAQGQAGLNAAYNQWLMAQQYPFQVAQLGNQTLGAMSGAFKPDEHTQNTAVDNSGWNAVGSIGTAAAKALLSDVRVKEDVAPIGHLHDGQNVYAFRYKGDPGKTMRLGLMAQEVEQVTPAAVHQLPSGVKVVDYEQATRRARGLGAAFNLAA